MSSTEDLLRERLARLAPTAPADAVAFEGVERRITHRRRQRAAARVAAVAAGALVAVGIGSLASGRDESSDVSTMPADTTTTAPALGAVPTVGQQGRVAFGGASFEVPDGWEVTSYDDGIAEGDPSGQSVSVEFLCIGPPGDDLGSCAIEMYHGDPLPGEEMQPYEDHGDWAWQHGTDPPQCPFTPAGEADGVQPLGGDYGPISSAPAVPVGDRTAVYDEWSVVCDSGSTFNPRAWHLSDEQLLILDVVSDDETEGVLESFRFDEAG